VGALPNAVGSAVQLAPSAKLCHGKLVSVMIEEMGFDTLPIIKSNTSNLLSRQMLGYFSAIRDTFWRQ